MQDVISSDFVDNHRVKVFLSKQRIIEWYEYYNGQVYITFSGGKDSTVVADLVWSLYPEVPAMFSNTGLEYPEIVAFVKKKIADGYPITILRPKTTFRESVLTEGFPLVSKKVATMVRRVRKPRTPHNDATHNLYLTGFRRDGVFVRASKIPNKWMKLVDAPFKTTEQCCDTLKKEPFKRYEKATGRRAYTGVMRSEGGQRGKIQMCNSFDGATPMSRPILPWLEEDVWHYLKHNNVEYSSIYDDRVVDGVPVSGETRTGCMFCAFGAHLESGTNRFQRMYYSHPKQWKYCIVKLGMAEPLDFIGVPYYPEGVTYMPGEGPMLPPAKVPPVWDATAACDED